MSERKRLHHTYQEQDGCHNCGRVFVKLEHEGGNEYFCMHGAGSRPLCMSVRMGEYTIDDDSAYDVWDEWSDGREVESYGRCENFVRK